MNKKLSLTQDALKMLNTIISITPSILQPLWKERILRQAEKNVFFESREEISSDDIFDAAKEVMPSGFSPLFVKLSNPSKFQTIARSGIEGYKETSKRWVKIKVKRAIQGRKFITRKTKTTPKIIALCGSPRRKGNSDLLIKEFFRGAESRGAICEEIYLHFKKISYCIGCRKCREKNDGTIIETFCTIKDDMTEIYKKLCEADAVVIGYPIYTARESAQTAAFWDRLDCMSNKYNKQRFGGRKAGTLITCWAWPEEHTYRDHMEGMMMLMGLRGIETLFAISASGCRGRAHGRGVVTQDEKGMEKVFQAGAKTVEVITEK
ncbi:MAG: flavodoxin family protein [Candidatus Schekmanbacteria bacterium]|nr:MAG: flavodoxin family protein [Candidatus Schekmanbacteria bacterium]